MARKKKQKERLWFFPSLFLLTPFFVFGIDLLYRYACGGDVSAEIYFDNFISLLEQARIFEFYVFPAIAFALFCIVTVFVVNLCKRRITSKGWLFISLVGLVMLLFGYRALFYITHTYLDGDVLLFLKNGVTLYTLTLSLMIDFLLCSAADFFDKRILK